MKQLVLVFAMLLPLSAMAENFVESGHFGVEGLVTADGVHAGVLRVGDMYEVAIDFDGSLTTVGARSGDMGLDTRIGYRMNGGSFNYFSLGLDYHESLFQKDQGVSISGGGYVGPYVGFQRYFPNSSVMLTFFIQPVTYEHNRAAETDANGNLTGRSTATDTVAFFQQGGLGIAYLF